MEDINRATSIAQLDVHLEYVRKALESVQQTMATKGDISRIETRMDQFATKSELDALRKQVEDDTFISRLKRWAAFATSVMTIVTFVAAAVTVTAYLIRLNERLPTPTVKAGP